MYRYDEHDQRLIEARVDEFRAQTRRFLAGSATEDARLGRRIGPALARADVVDAIERIIETYVALRRNGESFLETLDRLGLEAFKQGAYSLLRKSS